MKVLISGSSGLVGKALKQSLKNLGHDVISLVRDKNKVSKDAIFWDPKDGLIDIASLEALDAIINLAGENIGARRWTQQQKQQILNSRVQTTKTLVNAIIRLKQPPKVFISASAIGYYGNRGEEICTEESSAGSGFLAGVCHQWEEAAFPAEKNQIRTVFLRTGIVLSRGGGALAKMLPAFKLGFGGNLGSGQQYMSWIAIDDLVAAIVFILNHESVRGPINMVAPIAVKNAKFTKVLGKILDRPTCLQIPSFILRLLFGSEMANELLLASTRAVPQQLLSYGYVFNYPTLEEAFAHLLEKKVGDMGTQENQKSEKSFVATLLFCLILGAFGVHRFYVGKVGTGLLMLITLGGFGIWVLIDFIMIVSMQFRDKQGFLIQP